MSVQLGLLLALACALATNVAFLFKYRGACAAPDVNMRRPLASAAGLFRSSYWTIGFLVAIAAWLLHVGALSLAPISLVQAVIASGLVMLAVVGEAWFGFSLTRRQWVGLALSAAGLTFLAVTVQGATNSAHSGYSTSAMIAFESATVGLGVLLVLSGKMERARNRHGLLLGSAAGILFGVSDVSIKALTGTVPGDMLSIVGPWTLVAVLASIGAFYASARALQIGDAIPVIMMTSVAANVAAIMGGILVFGDPVGNGALEVIARSLAFTTVIGGLALVPGPVRAAHASG